MSVSICTACGSKMATSSGIETNGQYCPNLECTATNGPQITLNHGLKAITHRVREYAVCYYKMPYRSDVITLNATGLMR